MPTAKAFFGTTGFELIPFTPLISAIDLGQFRVTFLSPENYNKILRTRYKEKFAIN